MKRAYLYFGLMTTFPLFVARYDVNAMWCERDDCLRITLHASISASALHSGAACPVAPRISSVMRCRPHYAPRKFALA